MVGTRKITLTVARLALAASLTAVALAASPIERAYAASPYGPAARDAGSNRITIAENAVFDGDFVYWIEARVQILRAGISGDFQIVQAHLPSGLRRPVFAAKTAVPLKIVANDGFVAFSSYQSTREDGRSRDVTSIFAMRHTSDSPVLVKQAEDIVTLTTRRRPGGLRTFAPVDCGEMVDVKDVSSFGVLATDEILTCNGAKTSRIVNHVLFPYGGAPIVLGPSNTGNFAILRGEHLINDGSGRTVSSRNLRSGVRETVLSAKGGAVMDVQATNDGRLGVTSRKRRRGGFTRAIFSVFSGQPAVRLDIPIPGGRTSAFRFCDGGGTIEVRGATVVGKRVREVSYDVPTRGSLRVIRRDANGVVTAIKDLPPAGSFLNAHCMDAGAFAVVATAVSEGLRLTPVRF